MPELVPLREVARQLHTTPGVLRRQAERGEFPELLKVTGRHYLVRRSDLERWMEGRWTRAEQARAVLRAQAVRAACGR